ncbi:MAG: ABC transporter permease subunit [Hyphomicrobiaceae bacterium]
MIELDRTTQQWLLVLVFTLVLVALRNELTFLVQYPDAWRVPVVPWLNIAIQAFTKSFGWIFRDIAFVLGFPVRGVRDLLQVVPWPVTVALAGVIAHSASGVRLAAFTVLGLLYMVVIGYWDESMNSLALVLLSVPLALLIGFLVGVAGFFLPRAERVIMPVLDLLQTIPAFAYLIPILILFGFGPVVGLIASLLFAFPPMVRNTILGLKSVPAEVVESGLMSGATGSQLFWQVQVPTAMRQILLGANQTTMAALSMVIIASIIGGTNDIGWEVLSTMRKAQFGESLLAGLVIALLAMIMDRITQGFATRSSMPDVRQDAGWLGRHRHLATAIGLAALLWALSFLVPALKHYPDAYVVAPGKALDDLVSYIVVNYRSTIEVVKTYAYFFMMLPVRMGLEQTVSPYSWGFTLTTAHIVGYVVLVLAAAAALWRSASPGVAIGFLVVAIIFFVGITRLPWPAVIAMIGLAAYQAGGRGLAASVVAGLGFMLVTGIWPEAMMSVYLCGLAVAICFLVGTAIGILAAGNDRVSAFIRPINDTMQTMPLFVLLIPIVMIFKLGDFTALLAIIAYAIVPAIRYAEHGIRSVSPQVVEAAQSMGTTPMQMLWQVKLPLALPVLMVGLNQTVLYGISMLVITALVGTNDLGQRVYIGLGDGDFGVGMVAGLGMAFLAMITDRILQAVVRKRQAALGMV